MNPFETVLREKSAYHQAVKNEDEQHDKVRSTYHRKNNRKNTAGRRTQYIKWIDTSDPMNPKIRTRCIKHMRG